MDKKAQFYIITAIILSTTVFAFSPMLMQINPPGDEFRTLYQNYLDEVPEVVNSAIYSNQDIAEVMTDFNERFISYAKTEGIDFYMVTLITDEESIIVWNYFDENISIVAEDINETLKYGDRTSIEKKSRIMIRSGKSDYFFELPKDAAEIKSIFKTKSGSNIQVYVHD